MTDSTLRDRVRAFLARPGEGFDALALDVVRFQVRHNGPYRRFCRRRGFDPDRARSWEEAPPLPTDAFRVAPLATGPPARIFRTSGTTGGARGEHRIPDLSLYDAAWPGPFRRFVLGGGGRMPVLSLIPPADEVPDSSLSYMASGVADRHGDGVTWAVHPSGFDEAAAWDALARAETSGRPLLVLTTAFAAVHLLDLLAAAGRRLALPAGSRVMDTGGFKGRTRTVSREELLRGYEDRLGVPPSRVIGEYGMTELCSQFYERVLESGGRDRSLVGPAWTRTRILDPRTLRPVPDGATGLVAHFDLANAFTVSWIVTGDLGRRTETGFALLGRAEGAALRGCSLATEEILER